MQSASRAAEEQRARVTELEAELERAEADAERAEHDAERAAARGSRWPPSWSVSASKRRSSRQSFSRRSSASAVEPRRRWPPARRWRTDSLTPRRARRRKPRPGRRSRSASRSSAAWARRRRRREAERGGRLGGRGRGRGGRGAWRSVRPRPPAEPRPVPLRHPPRARRAPTRITAVPPPSPGRPSLGVALAALGDGGRGAAARRGALGGGRVAVRGAAARGGASLSWPGYRPGGRHGRCRGRRGGVRRPGVAGRRPRRRRSPGGQPRCRRRRERRSRRRGRVLRRELGRPEVCREAGEARVDGVEREDLQRGLVGIGEIVVGLGDGRQARPRGGVIGLAADRLEQVAALVREPPRRAAIAAASIGASSPSGSRRLARSASAAARCRSAGVL